MKDTISRSAAIEAFAPYAEYESNRTNAEWVRRINMVLSGLPPAETENTEEFKKNLLRTINAGIVATNTKDDYSCGMRNGMRWCRSLLDDKEPLYENYQPTHPEGEQYDTTESQ